MSKLLDGYWQGFSCGKGARRDKGHDREVNERFGPFRCLVPKVPGPGRRELVNLGNPRLCAIEPEIVLVELTIFFSHSIGIPTSSVGRVEALFCAIRPPQGDPAF